MTSVVKALSLPKLVRNSGSADAQPGPVWVRRGVTEKMDRFLATAAPATPCVIIDLDVVEQNYRTLRTAMPSSRVFYAVKANPEMEILRRLAKLGACFDTSSLAEIQMVLNAGVAPDRISFGNTIKHRREITEAYDLGIRLYAFDSQGELDKLAAVAPGSQVYCRLSVSSEGAEWPLARKFGCSEGMAIDLLVKAAEMGLEPVGVSFHVGSQQLENDRWIGAIEKSARVFRGTRDQGVNLWLINLGGGFPIEYREAVQAPSVVASVIEDAIAAEFGDHEGSAGPIPQTMIEPGRAIVASAGVLETEVLLVAHKDADDPVRWVTVDIGIYGGLAEANGESIRYPITSTRTGTPGPVILAGPTCDSTDILYMKSNYELPGDLQEGDILEIVGTGAYTLTYSSVSFNGFEPLTAYCI